MNVAARVPLFRLDAGWLFIVAGLAVCVACVLTSADHELQTLRVQKSLLEAEEQYAYARLKAHEDFLSQLDNPDEALVRRLAAAELNLMPADEEPVLRLITLELPTIDWIDHTVERPAPTPVLASHSMLTQLATGPYRLWLFGGGVMCVFLGLLLDPGTSARRRRAATRGAAPKDRDDGGVAMAVVEDRSGSDPLAEADEVEIDADAGDDVLVDDIVSDSSDAAVAGSEVAGDAEVCEESTSATEVEDEVQQAVAIEDFVEAPASVESRREGTGESDTVSGDAAMEDDAGGDDADGSDDDIAVALDALVADCGESAVAIGDDDAEAEADEPEVAANVDGDEEAADAEDAISDAGEEVFDDSFSGEHADDADVESDFEEYELIADDAELVEIEDALNDVADEPCDDPFAAHDVPHVEADAAVEMKGVISIRPSMSVAPPDDDEMPADSGSLWSDDEADDSRDAGDDDGNRPLRRRGTNGKSRRARK